MQRIRLTLALVMGLSASCGSMRSTTETAPLVLQGSSLTDADKLLKQASRATDLNDASAVYSLRAAEIAWAKLDTDGGSIRNTATLPEEQQHALQIIATATENLAPKFVGANYKPEKTFAYGGYSYQVSATRIKSPGALPLARLMKVRPASEVPRKLCRNWHIDEGAGAPFAPTWSKPTNPGMQRFVSKSRSYIEPITGVLSFDGPSKPGTTRKVSLVGYDPTSTSRVHLGATEYPLAADFTAPIVDQTHEINELNLALRGLFHADEFDAKLLLMEPHDPKRIPIILVHGLNSHPRMWVNVINDLRSDPQLRGVYQFMVYYYPTGWPISYSSMRLREELAAFEQSVGIPKKMVLVGHSMGGLVSRMQVVNPGKTMWKCQLGDKADELDRSLPADHLARRLLMFKGNTDIGREVYICTPHRGSGIADLSFTNFIVKIVNLPTRITSAVINLPGLVIDRANLTSVKGLSPSNPLFAALDQIPIPVPHHSIIGDRGKGGGASSSDGVVPYWSSHLDSAESEVIVPDDHGAFDNSQTILELRRILLLNAGIKNAR